MLVPMLQLKSRLDSAQRIGQSRATVDKVAVLVFSRLEKLDVGNSFLVRGHIMVKLRIHGSCTHASSFRAFSFARLAASLVGRQ